MIAGYMRLGVYTSGGEALPLFHFLRHHAHDVVLYVDWNARPIDDKGTDYRTERLADFFSVMKEKKVDMVILPPMVEVAVRAGHAVSPIPVLPLYETYIEQSVVPYSLVGKMGILAEPIDLPRVQASLVELFEKKQYNDHSRSWRTKDVGLRKYYQTRLGVKDWMVKKTVRTDLRYYKDAAVDTLIPTSRGHFHYQSMIKHMVSWKRMRFHGYDALEKAFTTAIDHANKKESSAYSLDCVVVGDASSLLEQRRWRILLGE